MLFIEFDILDDKKFEELLKIYPIISKIHFNQKPEPIEFWLDLIPGYSKANFNLVEYEDPNYEREKINFEMMMDYLQINLEVEYKELKEIETGKGKLDFLPLSFPYGGMDNLIIFLKTFDCKATKIDSGFGIKKVIWIADLDLDFECEEI